MPVVHLATIVPISQSVGANRIVPTVSIPHPLGNPNLSPDDEKKLRRGLVERALQALQTEVQEQTVFKSDI